ncbi:MAG: tyrosine--tRNA ligase [Defluviitaleaceae bacterium]|nr:tyrosine--tRNA ligase [Defluviitaleaceae bacterium]
MFETLKERGFIFDTTHEEEIKKLLNEEKIKFYIGFDPTADSLHIGHFLTFMAVGHLQAAGHTPIILLGGGTGMIGDPTDRTDMRKVLSLEEIDHNVNRFAEQVKKLPFIDLEKAIVLNNANWLKDINYMEFLRDFGADFSVNRMLSADSYKSRYEKGLTFLEFNYMILQAYDFLYLNKEHGCILQIGGRDQWSNILAGVDLIRRKNKKETYGLTLSLLETAEGKKMGKTANGAIWLDEKKTSPHEFYQFFRNVEDSMVCEYLRLLTFVSLEEIKELENLKGKEINKAKERLAYEVTKLIHGEREAADAKKAALSLFGAGNDEGSIPKCEITEDKLDILTLLEKANLIKSRSEGRRLIAQNGIKINDENITNPEEQISIVDGLMIQKGKKNFCKVIKTKENFK